MDVLAFIAKDITFPVITQEELDKNYEGKWDIYLASGPHLHDYLQEMNKEVLSKYDVMSLAEGAGMIKVTALNFVDANRKEVNMDCHFDGVSLEYVPGYFKKMNPNWSLVEFKKIYSDWDAVYDKKGWGTIYLGNHDQPRMTSRWGNDSPQFRELSSKMLTTFLLSMKGTPYYYNGDEIGMVNANFDKIADYRDIETLAEYQRLKNTGGDLKQFIEDQKTGGARDNGRTPFQWDTTKTAGFSTVAPWLNVNNNYTTVNAAEQEKDPNSVLNYFRKMVKLRKKNAVLIYGKYTLLDKDNPNVDAYTRELDGRKILILLNFPSKKATVNTKYNIGNAKVLIGNYTKPS